MRYVCNINGCPVFDDGINVFSCFNAKLKIAGDSAKVTFYQKAISSGFKKNKREKPEVDDSTKLEEPENVYDPQERWHKTGRRARAAVYDFIACNIGKHRDCNGKKQRWKFVTYTFREDVKEYKEANKLFDKAMERLNYHFTGEKGERFLRYLAVPQLQDGKRKDGTSDGRYVWHYHVFFFNLPFIPVSGKIVDILIEEGRLKPDYDKRDTLYYLWGEGGVDIEAVKFSDNQHLAGYVAKYIGKGLDGVYEYAAEEGNLRRKRYLRSSGLLGPRLINAMLNKQQRQSIANYFAQHCKHFKRRKNPEGEPQAFYSTFNAEIPPFGGNKTGNKIFGIDFRASDKQLRLLEQKFDRYSFGLC